MYILAHRTSPGSSFAIQLQIGLQVETLQKKDVHIREWIQMYRCVSARVISHLYVSAVMSSGWQLDPSERDRTFERDFDRRLLYTILSIQTGGPGDCAATEISLYWRKKEENKILIFRIQLQL